MTPPTEAQEQTLDPIERLRVVAAIGGAVTLEPETIRALLTMHSIGLKHHENGRAAYQRAIHALNRSMINAAISLVWSLAVLSVLLWSAS